MAYIHWDENRLLKAYPGKTENEPPSFTWTYSTFETYLNEYLTPSMYHFMASFVARSLTHKDMDELERGEYMAGDLEEQAVDAYFDLPLRERITMHTQELTNLEAELRRELARETDAISAVLDENKPWDRTSPIDREYTDFMRGIVTDSRAKIDSLTQEIAEEYQWVGGYEEGVENRI